MNKPGMIATLLFAILSCLYSLAKEPVRTIGPTSLRPANPETIPLPWPPNRFSADTIPSPPDLLSPDQENEKIKTSATLHGYIKNMPSLSFGNRIDSAEFLNLFHNRINFKLQFPRQLSFKMEMRNRVFAGSQVRKSPGLATSLKQDDGFMDLAWVPASSSSMAWQTNIDRLSLNWYNEKWDLTIGRQRINWGIHNTWNPNDLFNTFNFLDFDYEERPGSDAVRIQYSPKPMQTIEAAWKVGRNGKDHVAAMLYRFNKKGYDWQLIGARYINDWVAGIGWAGGIRDFGFKGEASYFHPSKNFSDTAGTLSFSTGLDISLDKEWYLSASYLLNSSGNNKAGFLGSGFVYSPTARTLLPLRHSFFFQGMKAFTPILSANAGIMYAPGGANVLLFFPSLQYSLAENWELAFFSQHFFGDLDGYKALGHNIYLRVKWNF
ncbi:hypothetical protein BC349_13105 [Flavihumibacter stibioxidans]|uniref:Alginate export domain-containing protein n=2 Tax=Flavihumibacter stibioxidans TaxID=1834163 RepID=A0ABR7MB86_9BACT|nr:hypothetical protein [Flavihumibacter stibioxidans]